MKSEDTLYEILEVSPHASASVVKAAYRCLAQCNHPDKNAGADIASQRLAQINHAYSVLSDPDKRRRYDQMMALQGNLNDRRGKGMATRSSAKPIVAGQQGSRAFVFRPLV